MERAELLGYAELGIRYRMQRAEKMNDKAECLKLEKKWGEIIEMTIAAAVDSVRKESEEDEEDI